MFGWANQHQGPAEPSFRTAVSDPGMAFRDILTQNIPEEKDVRILNSSNLFLGFSIPAGGKRERISVGGDLKSLALYSDITTSLVKGTDFIIRHESIYGDTWPLQGGQMKLAPLSFE